jgi:hypothetical protein
MASLVKQLQADVVDLWFGAQIFPKSFHGICLYQLRYFTPRIMQIANDNRSGPGLTAGFDTGRLFADV